MVTGLEAFMQNWSGPKYGYSFAAIPLASTMVLLNKLLLFKNALLIIVAISALVFGPDHDALIVSEPTFATLILNVT